jgi:hypothetical protein
MHEKKFLELHARRGRRARKGFKPSSQYLFVLPILLPLYVVV